MLTAAYLSGLILGIIGGIGVTFVWLGWLLWDGIRPKRRRF
jgi:hypothetical protein